MAEVIWTQKAVGQLERIVKYIKEEQGVYYATLVLNKVLDSTRHLDKHPKMGQIEFFLEHKKSEYRYLVVWSYKVVYRVTKTRVTVSRVFHTSQNQIGRAHV